MKILERLRSTPTWIFSTSRKFTTKLTRGRVKIKADNLIKVIGFDLDDTLWDVIPVIKRAEKRLSNWIISKFPEVNYGEMEIKRARKKVLLENP